VIFQKEARMQNKGREALNTLIRVLITEARWDDVQQCIHQFTPDVDEINAGIFVEHLLMSQQRPSLLISKLLKKGLILSGPGIDKLITWSYSNKMMKLAVKAASLKPEEARVSRLVDIGCVVDPEALLAQTDVFMPLVSTELQKRLVDSLIYKRRLCDAWDIAAQCELSEYFESIPKMALISYKAATNRDYVTDATLMEGLYERMINLHGGPSELAFQFADWLATCFWYMKRKDDYLKWAELRATPGPTEEEKPQLDGDRWKVFRR
jgi:hypothetical protein